MKKYRINSKKNFLILAFFALNTLLFAQKSFEFVKALPIEGVAIKSINPLYFGTYESSKGSHLNYEFNEKGITINTVNIQAISRETLRESATYFVRNEHLFGVTEDSIPYVFQDDNYYFGVRNSIQIIGDSAENILHEFGKGRYILNYRSANGYTPTLIEFKQGELFISDFDYDSEGKLFKKIKEQLIIELPENEGRDILLNPTEKEWLKISLKELFPSSQLYKKL